jgi:hypothetical protein
LNTTLRYVAHLDILGMSKAVERNHDEAWGALSDFCAIVIEQDENNKIVYPATNEVVNTRSTMKRFSDTIVVYSLIDEVEDLFSVVFKTSLLFCEALKKCVPIRAGIAFGNFDVNPELDMFLGQALIDAYKLGESANWLGIVVDDAVYNNSKFIPEHEGHSLPNSTCKCNFAGLI